MYSIFSNSGVTNYGVKNYVVDVEEDLQTINISTAEPGSQAFVIESSKLYMLNSKKEWKNIKVGSSGGSEDPSSKEVIYDGGSF